MKIIIFKFFLGILLLLFLSSCQSNMATGNKQFVLMSANEEKEIGSSQHPIIVKQFGGKYDDDQLNNYVSDLGNFIKSKSEMPNIEWNFTILDSPVVNAFALPGGYVYVTRGLLALANSEAELASVLGHEIGHVTARHSAQRHAKATLAGIGLDILNQVVGTPGVSKVVGIGADLALRAYSRSDEYEADILGMRYTSKAGFDPSAAARFLSSLGRESRMGYSREGRGQIPELLSTHPRTPARVERAMEESNILNVQNPIEGRSNYLSKIDGLLYGNDRKDGYINNNSFIHLDIGFKFLIPEGFTVQNNPENVIANNGSSYVIFDGIKVERGTNPLNYIRNNNSVYKNMESIETNGIKGATAYIGFKNFEDKKLATRLVVYAWKEDFYFRFYFLYPKNIDKNTMDSFNDTIYSFQKISDDEKNTYKPLRIKIVNVGEGIKVSDIASRMDISEKKEEYFRLLNGMRVEDNLKPGQKVKIVIRSEY